MNDINKKSERNSAFEILRIIAIVFIIAHHFAVHGWFDFSGFERTPLIIFNETWIDLISQLGKVGVNLFVLISAFFLIDNNRFKTKKVLALILEMLTFSIIIGIIFWVKEQKEFTTALLKSIIFPFGGSSWWFMTSYLLLYILSPLLNLGIRAMNKKMHLAFIIIFVFLWSIMPTFVFEDYGFTYFGWFITLYLIASYIRLYDISIKFKAWQGLLISVGAFVLWFALKYGVRLIAKDSTFINYNVMPWFNLIDMNNFIQLICTVIFFLSFKKLHVKPIKIINIVASTTLAIYLFHDQGDVKFYLWQKLFKNPTYAASPYLFIYSCGVILLVFVIGVVIGLLYRYTIGLGYNKLLSLWEKKQLYKLDNIFNNVEEKEASTEENN